MSRASRPLGAGHSGQARPAWRATAWRGVLHLDVGGRCHPDAPRCSIKERDHERRQTNVRLALWSKELASHQVLTLVRGVSRVKTIGDEK
jgi:hypothetical protein